MSEKPLCLAARLKTLPGVVFLALLMSLQAVTGALNAQPAAPKDPADEAYLAGRFAEAYALYQGRALRNPMDLDAQDGITLSAVAMGKLKEAVAWYQNLPSSNAGWCYGAARAVLSEGDRKQASALLFRAVDIDKKLGRAYFLLGLLYSTQAVPDFPTAINAFNRAIALEPKFGPSYYQLARLEAGFSGRPDEARGLLARALLYMTPAQRDVRVQTHVLLGGLLSGRREYPAALQQFEAARALIGDAVYEQVNIGRVHELMGDPEAAVREWNAVRRRFGLASPLGLQAYRSIRRVRSRTAVDWSDFLPGAAPKQYEMLVMNMTRPRAPETVAVPVNIARLLDDVKVPVRCAETDFDGDGKVELLVVEVKALFDPDLKGYSPSKPTLHVFTPKGGALGYYDSQFDYFWDAATVDFDGDGRKEVVLAGFSMPNVLNFVVMTHQQGRRMLNTYAQTVACVAAPCGALIDDLDGDGKVEILTVEGGDLWVTVRRWDPAGTFTDACADFPEFYQDYVRQYERLKPEEMMQFPVVQRHMRDAHTILLLSAKRKPLVDEDAR